MRGTIRMGVMAAITACVASACAAQSVLGADRNDPATQFKDTSVFRPPAGARVVLLEWEDLECPYCARAFPSVHADVKRYGIALAERDYLIPSHTWSRQAALYARFLHDKVSPEVAQQYRRELFASQFRISSREDLQHFTEQFFQAHGKQLPSPLDPGGQLQKEVDADVQLGEKAGVVHTPTLVVASANHWTEVLDIDQLPQAIEAEMARAGQPARK